PRRHREHRGRRPRRLHHRLHRELQQRLDVARTGSELDRVARVHPADPDPRLQADRAPRRVALDTIVTRPQRHWLIALGVAALLVLYPVFYHHFLSNFATNWLPNTSTAFTIVAFTVMGLGLNFVVGYAGLLDL